MPSAIRIVQRNAMVYRRVWRGSLFLSFLQPSLYFMAIGLGLGGMVDRSGAGLPGGVAYLAFLGPGLLAASCMQTASFEASFPIAGKMTWRRNYDAILATPLRVVDLVVGELAWIGVRLLTVSTAFALVLASFGAASWPLLLAAVPCAALTGLAVGAPIMAFAGTLREGGNFNVVFRFLVTPLFLFSGVFFPVSSLPEPLPAIAAMTPLFHGVELTRGLVLQTISWPAAVSHAAYLFALLAAGGAAAVMTFSRRLHA
ncbi:MAG: ABC transporter permease [Vicinamibacterales bacterium]